MTATTENSRLYGGNSRVYPDGLHARQMDSRKWVIYDGTNIVKGVGCFQSKRDAEEWIALHKLMLNNVGPEWGYVSIVVVE